MQITQESPNLFRLLHLNLFHCFLVREDDGATLIDCNLYGSAPPITELARRLAWPIRRILLMHAHFDHSICLLRSGFKKQLNPSPQTSLRLKGTHAILFLPSNGDGVRHNRPVSAGLMTPGCRAAPGFFLFTAPQPEWRYFCVSS